MQTNVQLVDASGVTVNKMEPTWAFWPLTSCPLFLSPDRFVHSTTSTCRGECQLITTSEWCTLQFQTSSSSVRGLKPFFTEVHMQSTEFQIPDKSNYVTWVISLGFVEHVCDLCVDGMKPKMEKTLRGTIRFYFPPRSFTATSMADWRTWRRCLWRCNKDLDLINIWAQSSASAASGLVNQTGNTLSTPHSPSTSLNHFCKHCAATEDACFYCVFRSLWSLKRFVLQSVFGHIFKIIRSG